MVAKRDTLNVLSKQVNESSLTSLQDKSAMLAEVEKEFSIVSKTAKFHIEQIREEVQQVPMMVWLAYHVTHELYAGAANLKAIKTECGSGRLATQEIAEMLELESLGQIDPTDTQLESLTTNEKDSEIEVIYRLTRSLETVYDEKIFYGITALVIILIAIMVLVNIEVACNLRRKQHGSPSSIRISRPGSPLRSRVAMLEI